MPCKTLALRLVGDCLWGTLSLSPRRDSGQQLLLVWKIKIQDGGEPGPQTVSKLALSSVPPLPPSISPLLPPLPCCSKAKTQIPSSREQTNHGWVGGSKRKRMALQQLLELVLQSHPGGAVWCSLLPAGSTDKRSEASAAPRGGQGAPRPLEGKTAGSYGTGTYPLERGHH